MWNCGNSRSRRTSRYTATSRCMRTFSSGCRRSRRARETRRRLDFLDLLRVPAAVKTEDEQPLVAVQFPESPVRMEVAAQVALGGSGEFRSASASLAEFGE